MTSSLYTHRFEEDCDVWFLFLGGLLGSSGLLSGSLLLGSCLLLSGGLLLGGLGCGLLLGCLRK